jgi:hypothetical protein
MLMTETTDEVHDDNQLYGYIALTGVRRLHRQMPNISKMGHKANSLEMHTVNSKRCRYLVSKQIFIVFARQYSVVRCAREV